MIFSTALSEKRCALTVSATERDPSPSTLTGFLRRTAPAAAMSSGPISPPSGKSRPRSLTFTTWYSTRNRLRKPFSFGSRMCNGIWPPSKRGDTVLRALVPLVPRPAVFPPLPPSPRPTRVLAVLAPFAGLRSCSRMISLMA